MQWPRIAAGIALSPVQPTRCLGRAKDAPATYIPVLIDVTKISELRDISVGDKRVRLGAATPIQRFLITRT